MFYLLTICDLLYRKKMEKICTIHLIQSRCSTILSFIKNQDALINNFSCDCNSHLHVGFSMTRLIRQNDKQLSPNVKYWFSFYDLSIRCKQSNLTFMKRVKIAKNKLRRICQKKKEEEETNNTQFSAIHKIIDQLIWNQWTIFYKNITNWNFSNFESTLKGYQRQVKQS